jgi:serine/threonine protein kinase
MGARGRLPGILTGLFCAATFLLSASLLAYLPNQILGDFCFSWGLDFLVEWIINSDFGIAQLADSSRLTQTGMLVGSVYYLSAEALRSEILDTRADIWAFGVLLFEMLTGSLPFTGKNLTARLSAILTQPTPDISQYNPDIPKPIADLIYSMLEKDRDRRSASMQLVRAALAAIREKSGNPGPQGIFHGPVSKKQPGLY